PRLSLTRSASPRALPPFPTRRSSDLFGDTVEVDPQLIAPVRVRPQLQATTVGEPLHLRARHRRRDRQQADVPPRRAQHRRVLVPDRKSTRLNSSHVKISYAVFCLKKK